MELDKTQIMSSKHKDDYKHLQEEYHALQELYDRTAMQLTRSKEAEAKYKDDHERAAYELNILRERFDKVRTPLLRILLESSAHTFIFHGE
jgi:hypothetical protein